MFPIRVKLLPERAITAEAFTSGELNYLSDTTFPFSTCPWHLVHLHFPCTYRLKDTTKPHIHQHTRINLHVLGLIIRRHLDLTHFVHSSLSSTETSMFIKYCMFSKLNKAPKHVMLSGEACSSFVLLRKRLVYRQKVLSLESQFKSFIFGFETHNLNNCIKTLNLNQIIWI